MIPSVWDGWATHRIFRKTNSGVHPLVSKRYNDNNVCGRFLLVESMHKWGSYHPSCERVNHKDCSLLE